MYEYGLAGDGAVSKGGAVGGAAGDPEACAQLVDDLVRELDGLLGPHNGELRRRAEWTV